MCSADYAKEVELELENSNLKLEVERLMQYRKLPVVIEAVTFDELVEHGVEQGKPIINGMPWSFDYNGQPITHENDDCYLIPTLEGTMRFTRDEHVTTGVSGEIYPCKLDIFEATYEPVDEPATPSIGGDK